MHGPMRPFLDAGVSFNKISGLSQIVQTVVFPNRTTTSTTSNPPELTNDFSSGFTIGGGLDIHALLLHITPEIRYTRWGHTELQHDHFRRQPSLEPESGRVSRWVHILRPG